MPPANSPDSEQPPPSFFSALRELESPVHQDVLNLAATLGTPAAASYDDDNDDHRHRHRHRHTDDLIDNPDHDDEYDDTISLNLRQLRAATAHERLRQAQDRQHQHQHQLDRSRERLSLLERQRDALDQHQRLRRVMSRLSRLSDNTQAYGDRVPSQNSLYDWSPANEADDEDELDQILAELRREQPNTHPEILRVLGQSQLDSERARIRSISSRLQSQQPGAAGESLRSTAILQSVRRHPRFTARTREYLQRYHESSSTRPTQPAEPQPREPQPRERLSESAARRMSLPRLSDGRASLDRDRRDLLTYADMYRSSRASTSSPTASPMLEHTVKYLSRIRHSNTVDESLNCALDAGFLSKDYFCMQHQDFLTDTYTIPPPAETSWLAPGAVLSGCQHATSVASTATTSATRGQTALHQFRILDGTNAAASPTLPLPSRPWISNPYSSARSPSPQQAADGLVGGQASQDRWPVKVTIHAVDWERMSLSATMEAYNVPSHPHSHSQSILSNSTPAPPHFTRTSSITTFLEGEILDFNTHTMLTESFTSNPANDAIYWRKLPPFARMSDEELVKNLTSRKYLTEVLSKDWILMRWKERCFVKSLNKSTPNPVRPPHSSTSYSSSNVPDGPSYYPTTSATTTQSPYRIVRNPTTGRAEVEITPTHDDQHATFDDSGCGLTISGFYFVCLRRSDGMVEGLYYDPQSSPYQCLRLESKRAAWPAWEFR